VSSSGEQRRSCFTMTAPSRVRSQISGFALLLALGGCAAFQPAAPTTARVGPHSRRCAAALSTTEDEPSVSLKAMTMFSNTYAKNTGTFFCSDPSIPAVVIRGLAEHKDTLGAPLCPCRHYDDKVAEAKNGYWNCPCVPMRERHECHCMLFLTEDNEFAGDSQQLTVEEVKKLADEAP